MVKSLRFPSSSRRMAMPVCGCLSGYPWSCACFRRSMSSLSIFSTACMTLFDFPAFLSCNNLGKTEGTICHDTPYLSLSQPHRLGCPHSEGLHQKSPTLTSYSQLTQTILTSFT